MEKEDQKKGYINGVNISGPYKYHYFDPKLGKKLYDDRMATFRIPSLDKPVTLKLSPADAFKSVVLDRIQKETWTILKYLDKYYFSQQQVYKKTIDITFDFYVNMKHDLEKIRGHACTNAYLKMVEMCIEMDILRGVQKAFCNAELPGNFTLAIHDIDPAVDIMASSYMPADWNNNPHNILDDKYHLMRDNPDKWLIKPGKHEEFDGDVTKVSTMYTVIDRLGKESQDLYTSDIGAAVSNENFENSEAYRFPLCFGAVVDGLAVLKKGGKILLKEFSHNNSYSLAEVAYLSSLFDEFYILKPVTSRKYNQEVYLYGVGFRGISDSDIKFLADYIQYLADRPEDQKGVIDKCIIDLIAFPAPILDAIINAKRIIMQRNVAYNEELYYRFENKSIYDERDLRKKLTTLWLSRYTSTLTPPVAGFKTSS